MRAAISMWTCPQMIGLAALTTASYTAIMTTLRFATIPVLPGIVELRVASAVPMVFGLLFGPAGAWGLAIGNLIGDVLAGELYLGSLFGVLGNFLLGFVPYALWSRLGPLSSGDEPAMRSGRQWAEYLFIAPVAAAAGAVCIGWGVQLIGAAPYPVVSTVIMVNSTVGNWIGSILLLLAFGRMKSRGLLWQVIVDPADIGQPVNPPLGATLMVLGSVAGWLLGAFVLGGPMIVPIVGICLLAIIVAACLL